MSWKNQKQIKLVRPLNLEKEDAETWKVSEYNPASIPRQGQKGIRRHSQAIEAEWPDGIDSVKQQHSLQQTLSTKVGKNFNE